jgi:hypothetical protein
MKTSSSSARTYNEIVIAQQQKQTTRGEGYGNATFQYQAKENCEERKTFFALKIASMWHEFF